MDSGCPNILDGSGHPSTARFTFLSAQILSLCERNAGRHINSFMPDLILLIPASRSGIPIALTSIEQRYRSHASSVL
jgi:hypothetical protein